MKMFNKWAKKVDSLLSKNDETSLNYLSTASKWLRYWARKLRNEEPENYDTIRDRFIQLSGISATRQNLRLVEELEKAKKHRIGTKVRIDKILRYVYHFRNYVYPSFIDSNKKHEVKKILGSFWNTHFDELLKYRKILDDQQILWVVELAELTDEAGFKLDSSGLLKMRMEMGVRSQITEEPPPSQVLLKQFEKDLENWETHTTEFKRKSTSDHELAEAIAGFATANPGRIYIGVGPDKTVEGVEGINVKTGRDKYQLKIARITKDLVRSPIRVEVHFIPIGTKKTVVRIDVPKGMEPVYFVDYRPFTRYLSQTRKLEPSEVKEIYGNYWEIRKTAGATANAAEGQTLNNFLKEYSSNEMLRSLRILNNWREEEGIDFAKKWIRLLRQGEPRALEVDLARRKVSHYFQRAVHLHEKGYSSQRLIEVVCQLSGIDILYRIVEPLEKVLNPNYDSSAFARLRRICTSSGIHIPGSLPVPSRGDSSSR